MDEVGSVVVLQNDVPDIFEWKHPVIRRGGVVTFTFDDETLLNSMGGPEKLRIHVIVNDRSLHENEITYNLQEPSKSKWNLKISSEDTNKLVYRLEIPSDCEIGEYEVQGLCGGDKKVGCAKFLVLFNAWNPDDDTYMPNEEDREEYILNTRTVLFQGKSTYMQKNMWELDQFSKPAIELLLHLLKRMDVSLRSDFTGFARELTALVNNFDDDGVIAGKWDGEYSDGKPPYYWTGSKEIFIKYMKHLKPVKYGQCFTFAAVLCSLFRLAGIGCRVITCFKCLHNAGGTLDQDVYLDEDFNLISSMCTDSVWNFHCWNECYMKSSVSEKYNGWHVCDATPQEQSDDGRYVCGPAPVAAIKAGDIKAGYDGEYVFSEVNGDVVYKRYVDSGFELVGVETSQIGHNISTKAVGSFDRNDITPSYKFADGSLKDVMARKAADSYEDDRNYSLTIAKFRPVNHKDHILMGDDLDLKIDLLYGSNTAVDVVIKCVLIQQPNIRSEDIVFKKERVFATGQNELSLKVDKNDILKKVERDFCEVFVELYVCDEGRFLRQEFSMALITPSFSITVPEDAKIAEKCEIRVNMENPFPTDIEDVFVRLKGDFTDEKHKKFIKKICTGQCIDAVFDVTPNKKGCFEVKAIIYAHKSPTFHEVASINIA